MSDRHDGTMNTPDEPAENEREPDEREYGVPARSRGGEQVDQDDLWVPTAPTPEDAESPAHAGPGSSPAVSPPRWSGCKTAIAAAPAVGVGGVGAVGASARPLGSGGDSGRFPDGRSGSQFPGPWSRRRRPGRRQWSAGVGPLGRPGRSGGAGWGPRPGRALDARRLDVNGRHRHLSPSPRRFEVNTPVTPRPHTSNRGDASRRVVGRHRRMARWLTCRGGP